MVSVPDQTTDTIAQLAPESMHHCCTHTLALKINRSLEKPMAPGPTSNGKCNFVFVFALRFNFRKHMSHIEK